MNNIIEKLGMKTPDELRVVGDVWKVFELAGFPTRQIGNDLFRDGENIKKILDEKNEMLEDNIKNYKLFKHLLSFPVLKHTVGNSTIDMIEGCLFSIEKSIEKATGKSWEEICNILELLNE